MGLDRQRFEAARAQAIAELLAARGPHGHWEGELSSSALSTATAVTALAVVGRAGEGGDRSDPSDRSDRSDRGLLWLARHANPDGGWGDTVLSHSNLSTTTLCWAAFGAVPGAEARFRPVVDAAEKWLRQHAGGLDPDRLAPAILRRYGRDRTFSVPILTMCALAGRLGEGRAAWEWVRQLPFELAACPHRWFAALRLPVVSYALPALIAIGQVRHVHRPTRNPLRRRIRDATTEKTLRVLSEIQPASGGFLEATPLTSFVTMSLAGRGLAAHPVTRRGVDFLRASQRADGSWPIDTNLATWLTTLALNALGDSCPEPDAARRWLLAQQHRVEHPYTHAAPGGWAWTDLSGGVPDADDTAGALLALRAGADGKLRAENGDDDRLARIAAGLTWLLDLQNRDGGVPTFCRGWGTLPFDRSSADITAHALRAWLAWGEVVAAPLRARMAQAVDRAVGFLARAQRPDGAWAPLWFGCQHAPDEANLTYGTARVLRALIEAATARALPTAADLVPALLARGAAWLLQTQQADGGWGGAAGAPPSVEETALATEALAALQRGVVLASLPPAQLRATVERGAQWLVERVESGQWRRPAPIGFYFAKLWYFERLYPLIFTVGALNETARALNAR